MDSKTSKKIADQLLEGDPEGLRALLQHSGSKTVNILRALLHGHSGDAEDILQDAILRVWCNRKEIDRNKNIGAWLTQIALNLGKDLLKKKRTAVVSFDILCETVAERAEIQSSSSKAVLESAEAVNAAINELAPLQRGVLRAKAVNEHATSAEIASELNSTATSVRVAASKGVKKLVDILKRKPGKKSSHLESLLKEKES